MSVFVTVVWTCDLCGRRHEEVTESSPWSDVLVSPPDGWDPMTEKPVEKREHPHGTDNIWDACDECIAVNSFKKLVIDK